MSDAETKLAKASRVPGGAIAMGIAMVCTGISAGAMILWPVWLLVWWLR